MSRNRREEGDRPRSQERKRSLSKKEKMEQIRLQFKVIVKKLKEIKSQERSDANELGELIRSGDRIHRMTRESIQKVKQVLKSSSSDRRRKMGQSITEMNKEDVPHQLTSTVHSQSTPNMPKPRKQSQGSVVNEEAIVIVRQALSKIERRDIETTENSQIAHYEQENISSSQEVNRIDNQTKNQNEDRSLGLKYPRYEVIVDEPDREDDQLSHSVQSVLKPPPSITINLKSFTIKSSLITQQKINSPRPIITHSQPIFPYIIALSAAILILCTQYQLFK